MIMLSHSLYTATVALIAACSIFLSPSVMAQKTDMHPLRIGTGGTAGTYFQLGSLIAESIGARSQLSQDSGFNDVVAVAQRSGGSVANVKDVQAGFLEAALVQADVAHWAYTGTGPFVGALALSKLRAVSTLYLESVHLVVREGSDITSVTDLVDHRVSIDELESGTRLDVLHILRAHNISDSDIKAVYLKPNDAIERVRDGRLDAFFFVGGYPVAGISDLIKTGKASIIPIAGQTIDSLLSDFPFFIRDTIPAQIYANTESLATIAVPAQLIIREDVDEALVYRITEHLWDATTLDRLANKHPKAKDMNIESALVGIGIPLHPGARRYYLEKGLDVDSLPR